MVFCVLVVGVLCTFKHVKKNKLSEYFIASLFGLKGEVLCDFPQICFKTTEKHSLAVCGSIWGEKQVFVNIFTLLLV